MPSVKISKLPVLSSFVGNGLEKLLIIQGGTSKVVDISTLFTSIKSGTNFTFDVQNNGFKIVSDSTQILNAIISGGTPYVGIKTATPDAPLHVYGDIKIGVSGTIVNASSNVDSVQNGLNIIPYEQIGTADATTNLGSDCDTTIFRISALDRTYTLANGINGQLKTLVAYSSDGGKIIVTPTSTANSLAWSSIVLQNLGGSVSFKYINNKWCIISAYNVIVNP